MDQPNEDDPSYEPDYDPSKRQEYEDENDRLRELLIEKSGQ